MFDKKNERSSNDFKKETLCWQDSKCILVWAAITETITAALNIIGEITGSTYFVRLT